MKPLRIVSGMIDEQQLSIILEQLAVARGIDGCAVELGCNVGTTSVYIMKSILDAGFTPCSFHVYDSFEGLPEKHEFDESWAEGVPFEKGGCPSKVEQLINHFNEFGLPYPRIHIGWFKEQEYPESISFAFFDGDFYTSIMDSWEKVYPRLAKGAIVCIHDYNYDILPGVKKACDDFLADKPEQVIECYGHVGIFEKL